MDRGREVAVHATIEFLSRHGYLVVVSWVFAEQLGLPIPSVPVLLAAGALAGAGRLSLSVALLCCLLAAMTADTIWFQLGRLRGVQVLRLLCRISLEPDSCVRHTEDAFSRHSVRTLLYAKFLPGLSTVAPPLAGIVGMRLWRFLIFNSLGTLVWAGTFLGLGYAFSGEIELVAARVESMRGWAFATVVLGLACYVAYKFIARKRFLRELRIARIGVDELKARIDAGEGLVIVDLRHAWDVAGDPETIPGALRMDAEELQRRHDTLPRDREVILFCT
jgi:membrane protein DedA with SNARE-associated domain